MSVGRTCGRSSPALPIAVRKGPAATTVGRRSAPIRSAAIFPAIQPMPPWKATGRATRTSGPAGAAKTQVLISGAPTSLRTAPTGGREMIWAQATTAPRCPPRPQTRRPIAYPAPGGGRMRTGASVRVTISSRRLLKPRVRQQIAPTGGRMLIRGSVRPTSSSERPPRPRARRPIGHPVPSGGRMWIRASMGVPISSRRPPKARVGLPIALPAPSRLLMAPSAAPLSPRPPRSRFSDLVPTDSRAQNLPTDHFHRVPNPGLAGEIRAPPPSRRPRTTHLQARRRPATRL